MQRILLLEDHPRMATLIRRALNQAGIECDYVDRLELACIALQGQHYSALLIDRGLPDGDGLTLVKRLRQAGTYLPCLVLTARDALHDRIDGLESGADDYLCKPFSLEELVARTRALLRRPPAQQSLTPAFHDVQIMPEQLLMIHPSGSVLLTRAEMQIILCLFKAEGVAVRRTALEAAAWGQLEAVTPNALDVCVHRLRRKLEMLGSSVHIINQRGVGYAVTG